MSQFNFSCIQRHRSRFTSPGQLTYSVVWNILSRKALFRYLSTRTRSDKHSQSFPSSERFQRPYTFMDTAKFTSKLWNRGQLPSISPPYCYWVFAFYASRKSITIHTIRLKRIERFHLMNLQFFVLHVERKHTVCRSSRTTNEIGKCSEERPNDEWRNVAGVNVFITCILESWN